MEVEPATQILSMPDADVVFYPAFFALEESGLLFEELKARIEWKQEMIRLYGKSIAQPRLTAWYGETGQSYTYSGITLHPKSWIPALLSIKRRIEPVTPIIFNSVLLNYYRDERDSVAWHADDEPELGVKPVIGSVSFGHMRRFQFKHRQISDLRFSLDLTQGSLLLMQGATQHYWYHQLPKTTRPTGPRINLTFRVIKEPEKR